MTSRVFALVCVLLALPAFAATNPVFSNHAVTPSSGMQGSTLFRWTTSAKNADGLPIIMVLHIVSGPGGDVSFPMAFDSGSTIAGASFHYDKMLSYSGEYQYYFVATTSAGGWARYPATSGTFSGPTSTPAPPDLIGSWMNTPPSVVVAGQPVTLQGQIMNAGGAAAGASRAQFFVSSNPAHSGATAIGSSFAIPSLAAGASSSVVSATWWPPSTGAYYVSLRADRDNQVAESNENNNDYQPWRMITAGNPIAAAEAYKVGVVLISAPNLPDANGKGTDPMPIYINYLDLLRRDAASSKPHRQSGSATVDLVVQLEVRWNQTQSAPGVTDFSWYARFADECRKRGIRWTPLLSTHYVPSYIKTLYAGDQLKAVGPLSFDPYSDPHLYLKHGPSSVLWRNDAADWVAQFIHFMASKGQLGPNGAVDEILVGNELMFPSTGTAGSILVSKDASSVARWNSLNAGQPFPTTFTDAFRDFRGRELGTMLRDLITRAKSELTAAGHGEVLVSTKLVPYKFYRTTLPTQTVTDRYSGYTVDGLGIAGAAADFAAIDSYPVTDDGGCGGVQWRIGNDLSSTRTQIPNRRIYVTELNLNAGSCGGRKMTALDVYQMFSQANQVNGRYLTLFALNSQDATRLTSEQIDGLRLVFDSLILP